MMKMEMTIIIMIDGDMMEMMIVMALQMGGAVGDMSPQFSTG